MNVKVLVTQSCQVFCYPVDSSLPGSSLPGMLQARILEWVAIPFFRGSSWPRDWTWVSRIGTPNRIKTWLWSPQGENSTNNNTPMLVFKLHIWPILRLWAVFFKKKSGMLIRNNKKWNVYFSCKRKYQLLSRQVISGGLFLHMLSGLV